MREKARKFVAVFLSAAVLSPVFAQDRKQEFCDGLLIAAAVHDEPSRATQLRSLDEVGERTSIEFTTSTIWTDSAPTMKNGSSRDLADAFWERDGSMEPGGLNDRETSIRFAVPGAKCPTAVGRMEERLLKHDEKGPAQVAYPYESAWEISDNDALAQIVWKLSIKETGK